MFLECNSMSWQHHFPFEQCTDFDPDFAFVLAQSIFVPIRSIRQDGRGAIFASQNSSCFVRFAMRIDLWAFDSSLHPTVATASNLLCWQRSCLLPTMETRSEESQFEWSSHDNASLMSPGRAYHVPPPPDGDSNDSETDEVPSLTHSTPFDSADTGPRSSPIGTCVECKNTNWNWMAAGWRCSRCGCEKFYDACHYGDSNDSGGTWIFVPHEAADHDRHSMERKPDDPGAPSSVGERAESEAMTQDPTVDPDTLRPLSRRQRKAHRRAAEERAQLNSATSPNPKTLLTSLPQTAPKASSNTSNAWRDDMLRGLNQAVADKHDKDKDWTIQKGPSPGVKYRGGGGTPPSPPLWTYGRDDLRAFQKWARKLEVWRVQIASYLPPNEAAMMLYVSLKGEAEEELEWCDIAQINHANGIDNIIEALKQPLMTKSIYLKRRYLHEYEYVQRYANESIRSFCNRYGRIERSLKSVDINVGGMYDSESRGSRLLERMRLGLEQQRLILVASGQSLDFEMIRGAAQVQFPDHRPTPPVQYLREFDGAKNDANGAQPRQPPRQLGGKNGSHFHGKDKGKGVGKGSPSANRHTTYVTEVNEAEELPDDQGDAEGPTDDLGDTVATNDETNENEDGQTEDAEEGDPADDLEEVARCLTVTARRLKGLTLGRKFSGGSKTIAQRKQESHCAACGAKGHWQGDSECPHASNNKGGKSGKSKSSPKGDAQPSNPGKKVLTVQHGGGKRLVTFLMRDQVLMLRPTPATKKLLEHTSRHTWWRRRSVRSTKCSRTPWTRLPGFWYWIRHAKGHAAAQNGLSCGRAWSATSLICLPRRPPMQSRLNLDMDLHSTATCMPICQ